MSTPRMDNGRRAHTIRFYRDSAGEYRWQRKAGNGYVVASSSQGYANKRGVLANAERQNQDILACRIVDEMGGRMASQSRLPEVLNADVAVRVLKFRQARARSLV